MISKADAILTIKSDAQISTDQDNKVIWHDGNPTNITDKQIEDRIKVKKEKLMKWSMLYE